ncbi:ABC transporter substrate-binding protein [Roseateles sp. DAIF2]|uniref:taurine ABC transporter substrate-binding protein n=1 Tax=Roseateles sp. DAIF2 TaxID=2714952 RepID=UPI0018A2B0C8|nr:ABC transporter substrate-binding protein [Roseateles sp. DAIF2]QPF73896.1 ABC transporter substrate-binding protein [Roseateles sp. DAIF2]
MSVEKLLRQLSLAVLALASLLLLPRPVQAQDLPPEVRFAYAGGPRVWILGKIDQSFDKAFGTKVRWIPFASGADVLSLFAANEIDIARFGSSPAAAGIARKLPIEIIGVPEVIATSERLIGRSAKGIAGLRDIEGKTVAYPPNSTAHYALEAAIKVHKLDKSKIRLVPLKPAEIVAAWKRGDIDAAYVWGPFTQQLEADGGKEVFATKALQKDGYLVYNNFVVRKAFAEKHPQLVSKFLAVYQQKLEQYQRDPEGSTRAIAEHLSIPVETARLVLTGLEYASLKDQLAPAYLGQGASAANAGIARAAKDTALFLAEIGEIRRADVPESYAPAINSSYVVRALAGQ